MGIPNGTQRQVISIIDLRQTAIYVTAIPHILSKWHTHEKDERMKRKSGALRIANIETFSRPKSGKIVA